MNNDFYNRVFLSNKVLNTTTVQPVIRPTKIEENDQSMNEKKVDVKSIPLLLNHKLEEKINEFEEKNHKLEEKINVFEEKINELEEKINEFEEKNHKLEEKINESFKSLEDTINGKNIIKFELNEFDKMIVKEES